MERAKEERAHEMRALVAGSSVRIGLFKCLENINEKSSAETNQDESEQI